MRIHPLHPYFSKSFRFNSQLLTRLRLIGPPEVGLDDGEDAVRDGVLLLARVEALHVEGDEHEHGHPEEEDVARLPVLRVVALGLEQRQDRLQVRYLVRKVPHHHLGLPHLSFWCLLVKGISIGHNNKS